MLERVDDPEHACVADLLQDELRDAAHVDAATDRGMARGVRDGDRHLFERAFRAYAPRLAAFAFRYCSDHDFAADLVQDAFIRLWQFRARIQPDRGLRNYLYTILLNLYRDEARRQTVATINYEHAEDIPAPAPKETEEGERDLPIISALKVGLARIDDDDRAMLFMVKAGGLTCVEVAGIFNVNEKTVRRRLERMIGLLTVEVRRVEPSAGRGVVWSLL